MGRYVNPGNRNYARVVNSGIYVDKTGMLAHLNQVMDTEQAWICVSRPRRFGKTLAADMAAAYYSRGCASDELFRGKVIAADASYEQYLNQCNVIKWDMAAAVQVYGGAQEALIGLKEDTVEELDRAFPGILTDRSRARSLPLILGDLYLAQEVMFVFIIDEWDAIYREGDNASQDAYTRLLRGMFKSAESKCYIRLAYLTGILPIKRYNSESALNNFREYTMTSPKALAEYVGFTDSEVRIDRFENDMKKVQSRDDVLTVLIHLGYLAYDEDAEEAYIPNEDARSAFQYAI